MDVKTLKPLHGWREFFGEVGVIVLGVLIALGAQQVVQAIQTHADERAFRATIDHEIGLDLFMYDLRARQFACDTKHVAELQNWLSRARADTQMPSLYPLAPGTISPYRSAWDTRDAQVFNHLPAEVRQKYAEFYDELANNWRLIVAEQAAWDGLRPYAEAGPISLADRRRIRPIIAEIRSKNDALKGNVPISLKIAEMLQVKEVKSESGSLPADWLKQVTTCRSVIASPAETAKLNSRG
jgi:hypothetical protein